MAWWREARFGMFIHWGVYAVPAGTYQGKQIPGIGEWIMNRGKIPMANTRPMPRSLTQNFDADAWVRLAKEAGMKYIVITSKHHDGFAMFVRRESVQQYASPHALRQGPAQGTRRRVPQARHQARLLLFAGAGLESTAVGQRRQVGSGQERTTWTSTLTRSPCRR
jgi:hypothetical protein